MISTTALRTAVIVELFYVPISVAISYWTEDLLPEEALRLEENQESFFSNNKSFTPAVLAVSAYCFAIIGMYFAAIIGLLRLRRWGAWLYLIAWIAALPVSFLFGFVVDHPIVEISQSLFCLLSGFILGLAFFSTAIPGKGNCPGEAIN
ncbi:MAG: hypothetical protein EOP06_08580 [Proteobacteria bacterium]|nr:MAG: hypothetical protein EOP06_08580 [Pseudomonadota bacterium]